MTLYKRTTMQGKGEPDGFVWACGSTYSIPAKERDWALDKPGIIHAYKDMNVACLHEPGDCLLWEARGEVAVDGPHKIGCHQLTTVRQLPPPEWTQDTRLLLRVCLRYALLVVGSYEKEKCYWRKVRDAVEKVIRTLRKVDRISKRNALAAQKAAYAASNGSNVNASALLLAAKWATTWAFVWPCLKEWNRKFGSDSNYWLIDAAERTFVNAVNFAIGATENAADDPVSGNIDLAALAKQAVLEETG